MAFSETIEILRSLKTDLGSRFAEVLKKRYLQRRQKDLVSVLGFLESPEKPVGEEMFPYLTFNQKKAKGIEIYQR